MLNLRFRGWFVGHAVLFDVALGVLTMHLRPRTRSLIGAATYGYRYRTGGLPGV